MLTLLKSFRWRDHTNYKNFFQRKFLVLLKLEPSKEWLVSLYAMLINNTKNLAENISWLGTRINFSGYLINLKFLSICVVLKT